MTLTHIPRARRTRAAAAVSALLAVPALAAGCASQAADDAAPSDTPGRSAATAGAPTIDRACPQDLSAQDLGHTVDYASADVDGDGAPDAIAIGSVPGAAAGCSAALVVTTADGTAAVALPGLEIVPPSAFVPGGAAGVGGESVIAAPVTFSPRGGGEVGLFTLLDGVLTPVADAAGDPWTITATIDDGGGLPQSIDCSRGGLTWVQTSSDGLGGAVHQHQVRFRLDGAELTRTGASTSVQVQRDPAQGLHTGTGLSIFDSC